MAESKQSMPSSQHKDTPSPPSSPIAESKSLPPPSSPSKALPPSSPTHSKSMFQDVTCPQLTLGHAPAPSYFTAITSNTGTDTCDFLMPIDVEIQVVVR